MPENLPVPRQGKEIESGAGRGSGSSSRRTSSGKKVKSGGGCLLPVVVVVSLLALWGFSVLA